MALHDYVIELESMSQALSCSSTTDWTLPRKCPAVILRCPGVFRRPNGVLHVEGHHNVLINRGSFEHRNDVKHMAISSDVSLCPC